MVSGVLDAAEPPRVVFDFETGDLQGWRVVEGEFGDLVCRREFFFNRPTVSYNKQGEHYLALWNATAYRPTRWSARSSRPCSCCEDKGLASGRRRFPCRHVRRALRRGRSRGVVRPGQNDETMQRVQWASREFVGRRVFLRVIDRNTGSRGR